MLTSTRPPIVRTHTSTPPLIPDGGRVEGPGVGLRGFGFYSCGEALHVSNVLRKPAVVEGSGQR